ncbi:Ig-like domain (group 3), partial [Micrococcales bacterium KH10]
MRPSPAPSSGGLGSARRGRRALAAGTALALSASLMGLTAPGAYADPIQGGSWSTSYESGQPQPLSRVTYEPSVNLRGETDSAMDLVTSVYSTDMEGSGAENATLIADREKTTKWLIGRDLAPGNPTHAIYTLSEAVTATGYEITSANDNVSRDPKNWAIYGSNSASAATDPDDGSWTQIDTVTDASFGARRASKRFSIDTPASYQYYRITVIEANTEARMQMSDWTLLTTDAPSTRSKRILPSEIASASSNPTNGWQAGNENFDKAHDGDYTTKALVASGINYANFYMLYELGTETQIDGYIITAGNDAPERDPKNWTIWATNDPEAAATPASTDGWTQIDQRVDVASSAYRRGSQHFAAASPGSYKWVQMRVTGDNGGRLQLSEWTLTTNLPDYPDLAIKAADARSEGDTSNSTALAYAGGALASDDASSAIVAHQDLDVVIGSNTALSYRIKPTSDSGRYAVVDVEYSDAEGTNIGVATQVAELADIRGNAFTTADQAAALTLDEWNQVTVPLGELAGNVINKVIIRYDEAGATAGTVTSGFVDDIVISDSPFTGDLKVTEVSDTQLRAGQASSKTLGVITGLGTVEPGNDLAAKLVLNDVVETELPLVLTETENGVTVTLDPAHRPQQAGTFNAQIVATLDEASAVADFTLTVIADDSLTGQFEDLANLTCFTITGTAANCDGNSYAYDRVKLAALGYTFGETGVAQIGGEDFYFEVPDIPVGQPDTLIPAGQSWNVSLPDGAEKISFFGAGNEGTQTRDLTIVFTDGSTQTVTVSFADWATGTASNWENIENTPVFRPQGRLFGESQDDNLYSAIFATQPVWLDVDGEGEPKTVDYIQLPPKVGDIKPEGQVHLYTVATEKPVEAAVVAPQVDAEVVAEQTVTQEFTVDLATVTGGEAPFSATINWGDGSAADIGVVDDGVVSGTHTYAAAGTYSAIVTVAGNGASAAAVVEIEVGRLASDIALSGPATAASNSGEVITATVTPAAATGQVQFSAGGENIGDPVDLDSNNEATLDVSALSGGENTVTVNYLGDDFYAPSSGSHDITITKAISSITAGGGGEFFALQSLPIHVTVTPAVEGRTVNVTLDDDIVNTGTTDEDGKVSIFVSPPVGTTSYGVEVVEDADYLGATADPVVMTLNKHNVGVNLDPIATEPVEVGTSVNLRAVLPATATGEVQFKNGTENIGDPVSVNLGVALLQTSTLPAGTYSVTAEYLGDDNHNGGVSPAQSLVIVKKTGSVSLAVPTADVLIGDDALVVATVPADAAGSVIFVVNGDDQSPVNVADGQASLILEDLDIDEYTVVAKFSGDATYEAVDSSAATFEVVKRAGSITLSTQTPSVEAGNEVVVEATLPATAGGTVTFLVDGEVYGSPVNVVDGAAEVTLSDLTIAEHAVTATYSGDARFTTATTSQALTITITKKSLSEDDFAIEIPVGAVEIGSDDELTVELPSDANGSVSFTINGGTPIVVPVEGGKASLPLADLPAGANEIVIVYSGDDNYAATAPQTVTITVAKLQSAIGLSGPIESIEEGTGVAVTATVNVGATGQVQFYVGGKAVGAPVNLIGNTASTTLNGLAAGRHTVTAKYLGDDTYESAQSADLVVVIVAKPGASVAVNAPVVSKAKQVFKAKPKQRVTVTASVSGVTSGTVTFRSVKTGDVLGTAPITKSGSTYQAVLRVKAKLAVGKYGRITASVGAVTSGQSARGLRVVKARPKKVTVRTKQVRSGASVKVRVKVAKLNNGRHANGRVQIRIGKRVIGSVRIKPKAKGNRTVTVKLSSAQRSGSSLKVRAKFV